MMQTWIKNRSVGLLLMISAILLIFLRLNEPGINFDSALYATIARNFAHELNWFHLHFGPYHFYAFAQHPPLAFWLQGFVFKLFGATDATARLLNSVSGVCIIMLIYHLGKMIVSQWYGVVAAAVALFTFQFLYASSTFLLDVTLTLWSLLAIYFTFRILRSQGNVILNTTLMSLFLSMGFMTKGVFVLIPIGAIGLMLFVGIPSWRHKFWVLCGLLLSSFFPMVYFYYQYKYGTYPYLWFYVQEQLLSHAHRNTDGLFSFGIFKTYFVGYAPWSFLFPCALFTLPLYCKKYDFHRFIYAFTALNFLFFMLSSRDLGHYLILFTPISSLAIATVFLYLKDKFKLPSVDTLIKGVLGIVILILFLSSVVPIRIRLSSESDFHLTANMLRRLRNYRIETMYCYGKGLDRWVHSERGQWYWGLPVNFQPDFEAYKQLNSIDKNKTVVWIKTPYVQEARARYPEIFGGLTVYFQTENFSFFLPNDLIHKEPALQTAPILLPQ